MATIDYFLELIPDLTDTNFTISKDCELKLSGGGVLNACRGDMFVFLSGIEDNGSLLAKVGGIMDLVEIPNSLDIFSSMQIPEGRTFTGPER